MESILSVGIDIGTTSTHLIVSRLRFADQSGFNRVPRLKVEEKEIAYRGEIRFTPLTCDGCIDAHQIAELISKEYQAAGIEPGSVRSGALIVTGETAKLRNAAAVARELASLAGDFVVASAGPNLESILAARGSGAFDRSKEMGTTVLNIDIGGGTVNAAVIRCGELIDTACLSLGGRSIKISSDGVVEAVTEPAKLLFNAQQHRVGVGMTLAREELFLLADLGADFIMDFVSGGERSSSCATDRLRHDYAIDQLCATGGVSELIRSAYAEAHSSIADLVPYNDLGFCLAIKLRERLVAQSIPYVIPDSAIRATVIGAGMHAMQVTGSTIDVSRVELPIINVPMIHIEILDGGTEAIDAERIFLDVQSQLRRRDLDWRETPAALYIKELPALSYALLKRLSIDLADVLLRAQACGPHIIVVEDDAAAAIGLLLRQQLRDANIVVIDGVQADEGDYIDIGRPIVHSQQGHSSIALPVVIKSLVFK